MKKLLAATLAAIFVLALLAGCGKRSENTENEKKTESLWGKSITYVKVELPDKALETESSVARAISPDGSRLFISAAYGPAPYLWDIDEEKKIPVTIGNDITADAFRFMFWSAAMVNIKDSDTMDKFREENADVDALKGDKLLERIYSTGNGPFLTAAGYTVPVKDNVMIVTDQGRTASFALDVSMGALYAAPEGFLIGVTDGTMYSLSKPYVIKYEMTTGKELERLDFSFAMNNGVISNAFVFADGTLCAVVYGVGEDMGIGVECVLGVIRPDGSQETYALGKRSMSQLPALLYAADSKYFVLQNSVSNDIATFVDTATGEVSLLVPNGSSVEKAALDSRLNEDGAVDTIPDDHKYFRYFTGMADGETIFCSDSDFAPSLFRPSTGEVKRLLYGVVMPVFNSYSGNGYDRWLFFDPIDYKNMWIRFDVK